MNQHGVYPSLPTPTGVPWSEYVRSQRKGSRSVSSSTEALDSDHARYITRRIAQHARSMATGTRSLPTDSPVPYFQPIERGHMSEGGLSDRNSPKAIFVGGVQMSPHDGTVPLGGTNYPPWYLQNQVFILDYMMTMTLCLKLGMAEEHWTLHL